MITTSVRSSIRKIEETKSIVRDPFITKVDDILQKRDMVKLIELLSTPYSETFKTITLLNAVDELCNNELNREVFSNLGGCPILVSLLSSTLDDNGDVGRAIRCKGVS